jgi:streptogramin lyase
VLLTSIKTSASGFRLLSLGLTLAAAFTLTASVAHAQVTFNGSAYSGGGQGTETQIITNVFHATSVAVDANGNVYDAEDPEIDVNTFSGGAYTNNPIDFIFIPGNHYVSVDASGNVFANSSGFESTMFFYVPNGSGGYTRNQFTINGPARGTAVDSAGNLYLCVGATIEKITNPTLSTRSETVIVSGLNTPSSVAVDASGDLYIADPGAGAVYLEDGSGSSFTQSTIASVTAQGVAVGPTGTVYIADTGDSKVLSLTYSGGTWNQTVLGGTYTTPYDVAVDSNNNVYVADYGANAVDEIKFNSVNLGSVAVNSTSSAATLNFTVAASTNIGSVSILTTGIANKDFADADGSTCTAQTYASPTTCVVNVALKPHAPGIRYGSVVIKDNLGNVLASVPLFGVGTGPQVAYYPSTSTTFNLTGTAPHFIAVDGNSNVYVPDTTNGNILKLSPSGTQTTVISGLATPTSVAVDGAGNLYIVHFPGSTPSLEVVTASTTSVYALSGASNPFGLAVDGSGNAYIADNDTGNIYKVAADGTQSTFASGFVAPLGLALDSAGNVYISDVTAGNIYEITQQGVQTTIATGLIEPSGVAIDAAGDLFYTTVGTGGVYEVLQGTTVPLASDPTGAPLSVVLDSSGNVFYSDATNANVVRINRSIAPTISFQPTQDGSTSTDSPQIGALQNIGNAPLTISSVSYPADFSANPAGEATACAAGSLSAGTACGFDINFTPVSTNNGSASVNRLESIKVTSNNLNVSGTVGRVGLSGTELQDVASISLSATSLTPLIGSGYSITATVSGSNGTPTGIVSFFTGGVLIETAPLVNGQASISPNFTAAKHTVTASYTGNSVYASSTASSISINVAKATTTIALGSSANPSVSGNQITLTATLTTTLSGHPPTGTVKFYSGGANIGSGTVSGDVATFATSSISSTHTITATYEGDTNYNPITSTGLKQVVNP